LGASLLVIEDDAAIRRGLELTLQAAGYRVLGAPTGELGLTLAEREPVALVLLDIMLPGRSGLDVCRTLRGRGLDLPIILVSARGTEADVVRGLEAGADDYVVKPFRSGELLARSAAQLRRRPPTDVFRFDDVEIDVNRRTVQRDGAAVDLSPTEFDLLVLFVRRAGDVLTRDTILAAVWGEGYEGTDRTVDNFVTRLRQKFDATGQPSRFLTVRGVGYRFEASGDTPTRTP